MLNGILFLFIIFFGQTFIESVEYPFGITSTNEISQKECDMRRWSSNESFVCACNSTYCDQPEPLGRLRPGKAVLFVSDPIKMRLKRAELQKGEQNAAIKNDGIKENIFNNFFQTESQHSKFVLMLLCNIKKYSALAGLSPMQLATTCKL